MTRPPTLHGDGGGLYLHVSATGSRSWIQRVVIGGRRRDIGLGPWPAVGLTQARDLTLRSRIAITEGRDPLAERRAAQAETKRLAAVPTFEQAARKTFEANRTRWRNKQTAATWIRQLEIHAARLLAMPVNEIEPQHVWSVLTPLWTAKRETARKLRGTIKAVLAWSRSHGHTTGSNAAGEAIDGALPAQRAVTAHHRALHYREVPDATRAIQRVSTWLPARACMQFLILTATRSGEARGAKWDEIDTGGPSGAFRATA